MYLELEHQECELLANLVRQRMAGLRNEFAHRQVDQNAEKLRVELETLERICHRLSEACYDVLA